MNVLVNGESKSIAHGTTIRQLVESLGLKAEKVAIELNRRLVRAAKYDEPLKENDAVEIVTFVGGG